MQKNPTTSFSKSTTGQAKPNLAKRAHIFLCLVIAKLDFIWISLYLAPK